MSTSYAVIFLLFSEIADKFSGCDTVKSPKFFDEVGLIEISLLRGETSYAILGVCIYQMKGFLVANDAA